ncbi:signal peptidase [Alkanindiges hydrocarboniclasticus]|jgi:uncharacterized protein (DUF2147 family)|uniref:Signal peptidase n=1 Tax=Alkanindiges hydrocarboniclasticus TaxID=1907941 RepID=A0A1S8CYT3_9GAMM|nr:DUF2147 domain-containing protein [Alkanindiges hydrocarboniclasticus]ONG41764.1 signal peptidase [Alkanindiges hydrocarboniclasticus]
MQIWKMAIACVGLLGSLAHAGDITGTWRTIDDKTGIVRAHIQITQQPDGSYLGTLIEDFPAPGEAPLVSCNKCPQPYTNKPIIGLQIFKGFREDPKHPNSFIDGKVLDPRHGKLYSGKAKLSSDGRKLRLRGYVGVSVLGRSQTWLRKE